MTPLYNDRFSGHQELDDPRDLLVGAAVCTWPTIPPWRYFFACPSGSDAFSVLRTQGLLMRRDTPGMTHDWVQWTMIGQVLPFTFARLEKQMSPDRTHATFTLTLGAIFTGSPAIQTVRFNPGKCNVDIVMGDFGFPNPIFGSSGADSVCLQVEYDETEPPGGFP